MTDRAAYMHGGLEDDAPCYLIVRGGWSRAAVDLLDDPSLKAIVLRGGVYASLPKELESCRKLQTLVVECDIQNLTGLARTTTKKLIVRTALPRDFDPEELANVEVLSLDHWRLWPSQMGFAKLPHLLKLGITSVPWSDLTPLSALEQLETLGLSGSKLNSTVGLDSLSKLKEFHLSRCRSLKSIVGLDALGELRLFHVEKVPKLVEIDGLEHLTRLDELHMFCEASVHSTRFLEKSPTIKRLWLDLPVEEVRWEDVLCSKELFVLGLRWEGAQPPTLAEIKEAAVRQGRLPTRIKKSGTASRPFYVVGFD